MKRNRKNSKERSNLSTKVSRYFHCPAIYAIDQSSGAGAGP